MSVTGPVLVTGASGFIGRRVVARLAGAGRPARAFLLPHEDPAAVPELAAARGLEIARGDLTDAASVAAAVRGASRVVHLAAVVGDWGPAALFERVNVGGTRHVVDAAAAAGCARLVMVSSIVVYGRRLADGGCDEDAPREVGVGPYGQTKRASEELALDAHAFGRVPVTVVRPGNVWGPGSGLWVDELVRLLRRGLLVMIGDGGGDACLAFVDNVVDVIVRASTPGGGRSHLQRRRRRRRALARLLHRPGAAGGRGAAAPSGPARGGARAGRDHGADLAARPPRRPAPAHARGGPAPVVGAAGPQRPRSRRARVRSGAVRSWPGRGRPLPRGSPMIQLVRRPVPSVAAPAASAALAVLAVLAVLVLGACDSRATPVGGPSGPPPDRQSRELESCGTTSHCAEGLRCWAGACQREGRSTLGDYQAARGARLLGGGETDLAIAAYAEALAAYEADKLTVPPDVDCAYGQALTAARASKEKAELAARVLHRCLLAVPAAVPLRAQALAALAELDAAGLDPNQVARPQLADLYLTRRRRGRRPTSWW
ncbi:MAG: NAD-dependent epimerase/dehydratase family protein [Kofleriaceae bacterium]|nr:NAD-dependent epimerase/dehydratase family protein [Kofleriaceae bacterium]